jgi:hypothetical protein
MTPAKIAGIVLVLVAFFLTLTSSVSLLVFAAEPKAAWQDRRAR